MTENTQYKTLVNTWLIEKRPMITPSNSWPQECVIYTQCVRQCQPTAKSKMYEPIERFVMN